MMKYLCQLIDGLTWKCLRMQSVAKTASIFITLVVATCRYLLLLLCLLTTERVVSQWTLTRVSNCSFQALVCTSAIIAHCLVYLSLYICIYNMGDVKWEGDSIHVSIGKPSLHWEKNLSAALGYPRYYTYKPRSSLLPQHELWWN